MRSFRRAVAVSASLLVAAGLAAAPATAGAGPALLDTHDSYIPTRAFEITSTSSGTVFAADAGTGINGHVYLIAAPATTGSTPVDLGDRALVNSDTAAPSIVANEVAVPQGGLGGTVTSVKYCAVGFCPTVGTFTVPAGYAYVGNAGDRAILYNATTNALGLAPWNGGAFTPIDLTAAGISNVEHATGDTSGVLLYGSGAATYLRRSDNHLFNPIDANNAVLTPTFIAWYLVGTGASFDETAVRMVARSNPDAAPSTLAMLPGAPDFNTFAATDSSVAWLKPQDDGSNLLYTLPTSATTPVLYPRPIDTTGLAPFQGGSSYVVDDSRAAVPGLYTVAAGSTASSLTALLPIRQAVTSALAVSNNRAVYADDMTEDEPVFLTDVTDGTPDYATETTVSAASQSGVGLSGPYVAFGRAGRLVYGRTGGALSSVAIPASDLASVTISGPHALVTGGVNSRLVDVRTGATTSLGHVYAAVFGDYLVTLNYDTGALLRKNLVTGGTQTIQAAVTGCSTLCVDEEGWQLAPWGNEVAYAYYYDNGSSHGRRSGLWNGNTGSTSALPGLGTVADPAYYQFRYWDGLFLVYATDFTVDLYNLRGVSPTTPITVETFGDAPMGMDGHVVAWRRLSDLRAVVRDVRDFVPGYAASPRYLGGDVPTGLAPGTANAEWTPSFLVSQDVDWTLTIHSGSAAGPVVRTLAGTSQYGEVAATWNGTNGSAVAQPGGTYYWTLTGTGGGLPLQNVAGTAPSVSGTVYLSASALPAPVLTTPTRSTDESATTTFTVDWTAPSGATSGTTYTLQRSVNGGSYVTVASGIVPTARSYTAPAPGTYRFRVYAVDAGGRVGAMSNVDTTLVPYDDAASGSVYGGSWGSSTGSLYYRGAQHRSTAAGSTYYFAARGTQIQLIGTRATTYGQLQVSVDGGVYVTVDAYSSTTKYRQVLFTKNGLTDATHTIRVRVVGTSGRPAVGIDGVTYAR